MSTTTDTTTREATNHRPIDVAFITCNEFPSMCDDDLVFIHTFQQMFPHRTVEFVTWSDFFSSSSVSNGDDAHNVHAGVSSDAGAGADDDGGDERVAHERTRHYFSRVKLVVLRSVWDYQENLSKFLRWLTIVNESACCVLNSLESIVWNSNKIYLQELRDVKHVPIVPSYFIAGSNDNDECASNNQVVVQHSFEQFVAQLAHVCQQNGWRDQLILKPSVSAASIGVVKVHVSELLSLVASFDPNHTSNHNNSTSGRAGDGAGSGGRDSSTDRNQSVRALLEHVHQSGETYVMQPFVSSIMDHGELSILFFDGQYSHAKQKKLKPGTFKWASYENVMPEESTLSLARDMVRAALDVIPFHRETKQIWKGVVEAWNNDRNDGNNSDNTLATHDNHDKSCPLLYARVDLLVNDRTGEYMLGELEIFEPFLFLLELPDEQRTRAAQLLARTIHSWLERIDRDTEY